MCVRHVPDGHEVFEGLGHLEPLDVQVAAVQEVVDPLLAAAAEGGGGGGRRGQRGGSGGCQSAGTYGGLAKAHASPKLC